MRIAMIGTGYVGLVSGACFSDFGHEVVCVDKDAGKIERLRGGAMPIYEPGLDALVQANVAAGRLSFTTDLAAGIAGADAVFIAVGTPPRSADGHADLVYVHAVAREIAGALTGPMVVVTKSTVPVGTGDEVERILREGAPGIDVAVVSNPEFLREGIAIKDFRHPDRVVIGTADSRARAARAARPAQHRCSRGGGGGRPHLLFDRAGALQRGAHSRGRRLNRRCLTATLPALHCPPASPSFWSGTRGG